MARYKHYINQTVLEAARQRIAHVYDVFDSVVVAFSGGKDSLALLHLVYDHALRLGRLPVDVIFRDEELIPDSVVDFVNEYRQKSWVRMRWYCYPMESQTWVLGTHGTYAQWGEDRRDSWVRQPPPWALRPPPGDIRLYQQNTMDDVLAAPYPGRTAFMMGIRASESLVRYRSVVNKLNENYICKPGGGNNPRVFSVKPVYDWEENDVMKFLGESGIRWSSIYDAQHLAGNKLRVATPVHVDAAKRFHYWRTQDPDFYQRVVDSFPEMTLQERYHADFDRDAIARPYLHDGFNGCRRYIMDHITEPDARQMAQDRLQEFLMLSLKDPAGYSPEWLLKNLVSSVLKRTIQPNVLDGSRKRRTFETSEEATS